MRAHPDLLAGFEAALRGGPLPPGLTAADPAEVPQRFAVYANNVAVGLAAALAARFPVIERLVGKPYFAALARVYAEADRPKSPVLAEWGAGFADFLAGFEPLAAYPYMPDVARIELARGRAFHAADAAPVDPARLADQPVDRLRLTFHPSVILLPSPHPATSIWTRNQPGNGALAIGPGPETALILRDVHFAVPVRCLAPGDAALVAALLSGSTLSDAAQAALATDPLHDAEPILVHLMRAGAITDARADTC